MSALLQMPRTFTMHYRGDDNWPYEVRVTCHGSRVTDIDFVDWEPSERARAIVGEMAVEKHLDWWDEMIENTPAAQKARDAEYERRAEERAKHWEPKGESC